MDRRAKIIPVNSLIRSIDNDGFASHQTKTQSEVLSRAPMHR